MLTKGALEAVLAGGQDVPPGVVAELSKPWADIEAHVRTITTRVQDVRLINRRYRRRHLTSKARAARAQEIKRLRAMCKALLKENAALREQLAGR